MQKKVYKESFWNLKDLLESHEGKEFDVVLADLEKKVKKVESYKNVLNNDISSDKVLEIIKDIEEVEKLCSKIYAYAYMWFSTDTKSQEARALQNKISQLVADVSNRIMFFSLWFKQLDDKNADRIIKGSNEYKYYFEKLRLQKPHTLSENEEKIINIKDTTGNSILNNLYNIITTSFMFDFVIDGKVKRINFSELSKYVRSTKAEDRKQAYDLLMNEYEKNKDTLGEIYKAIVTDWKNESIKLRKHNSYISPRNLGNDISDKAVECMLNSVKKNTKVFHRYFKLKAKLLGMKRLSRYDVYAPIFGIEKDISYNEAVNMVLESYNEFSPEMSSMAKKIIDYEHVHSITSDVKKGGAYCNDIHPGIVPYVFVNFTGKDRDVSTLAHELGHGVHDLLTHNHSSLLAHPPLILAETASVFGEMILSDKVLEKEKDKINKQALIASKLDDIYATIIRQTFFVIFEMEAHKAIDDGATIDKVCDIYLANLKEMFGDSIDVTDNFKIEWAYIPHIFATPFYCYAYSFGNLLTLALYQMYKKEGKSFVPKYLKFLSYGGSKKPSEICKELDIDLESEKFWDQGFVVINDMIDELEGLTN
ncbi:M3 family oligoendopeptidase [Candidatus Woesearchaeota archaeon]|nr:MAG: oligoendopeptidase F [archaeon GW2011_AR18]MBS3161748.1 M3 family oligoendopeptidase [Candidatus Woesearchaeota archaeon]HIH26296.1 M3 family oligoendopeptidase [Nanoarchaeota archaeon]